MFKKIFPTVGILIVLNSSAFACGCVDAFAASSGANTIINNYKTLDIANNSLFNKQLAKLKKELQLEIKNRVNSDHEVIFRINSIVDLKLLNFSIKNQKKINVIP